MLVVAGELTATEVVDAEITLLDDAPAMKHRARVHLHAFTSEVMASVSLYDSEPVKPGVAKPARLHLSEPIVFAPGDRFVLRQPMPAGTIGGGRVLDAQPLANARRVETQKWLEQMVAASAQEQIRLRVQRRDVKGIGLGALSREMGLKADAVRRIVADLIGSGDLVMVSDEVLVSRSAFSLACEAALDRLKVSGAEGLKRSVLQNQSGLSDAVFISVIDRVVAENRVQVRDENLAIGGAAPAISGKEVLKLHDVGALYRNAHLAAPTVREAAHQLQVSDSEMRRLITLLIREKTLVRMGSDEAFVHSDALRELAAKLGPMRGKTIDVAAFKKLTGLTRKHAIPLLEYLDRERITRKQGDVRTFSESIFWLIPGLNSGVI